jgi:5'(3')-deoxyribonucleotidase
MRPQLYLDCDGVLADFDAAATKLFSVSPREAEAEIGAEKFWKTLERQNGFYRNLPLMPDAPQLFAAVKQLKPIILTGCPEGGWAGPQKMAWAAEHFPETVMITCPATDKREHMKAPGDILVDDQMKHAHLWVERGGQFIHHHNARRTIDALIAQGVLRTVRQDVLGDIRN